MAVATPNPLIPLSVKTADVFGSFQAGRQGERQNQLLQAQTAGVQQRTQAQSAEAQRLTTERAAQQKAISLLQGIAAEFQPLSADLDVLAQADELDIAEDDSRFQSVLEAQSRLEQGLQAQLERLKSENADTEDTSLALALLKNGNVPGLQRLFGDTLDTAKELDRKALGLEATAKGAGIGDPSEQRTFESLIAGFSAEDQESARRVEAGLDPRKVGSGAITTATTEGLTEKVATSEEEIKQRTKFAEMTGSSRAKAIDKGFETIQSIDENMRNMSRAITALEGGASTGAIESRFFPSLREASIVLDQIQGELALDVVGAVTFGALSKGELDLARSIALPTGLQPPELIKFLQERQTAQGKLRDYYNAQIQHLDQGGTIASFLRQQQPQASQPAGGLSDEEIMQQLGL